MIATAGYDPEDAGQGVPNQMGPLEWCSAEEVLKAHQVYLKTIANMILPRQVKVKHAPSDLVQDVALVAFRDFCKFKGSTVQELHAWLEGILKNKCMQAYRNVINRGEVSLEGLSWTNAGSAPSKPIDLEDHQTPEPQKQASRNELRNIIRMAIMKLPVKLGVVLLMKWEEGLEVVEVARRLGIEKSAAQKRYERGMARLQDMPELKRLLF